MRNNFFIISNIDNNLERIKDNFFYGYSFTKSNDFISGNKGYQSYIKNNSPLNLDSGKFIHYYSKNNKYIVETDPMGMDKIFYFKLGDFWAISNSLSHLINKIKNKFKLTLHLPTFYCYLKKKGQILLITNKTYIKEIKILNVGESVEINYKDNKIKIIKSRFLKSIKNMSYSEYLPIFLQKVKNNFKTILNNEEIFLDCDISGGFDSRPVASILAHVDKEKKAMYWCNNNNNYEFKNKETRDKDLIVAKKISDKLNIKLTPELRKTSEKNSIIKYENWANLNLGMEPNFYWTKTVKGKYLRTGGMSGELYTPNRINNPFTSEKILNSRTLFYRFENNIPNKEDFIEEFKKDLKEIFIYGKKLFPNYSDSAIYHMLVQNRFHFGRHDKINIYNDLQMFHSYSSMNTNSEKEKQLFFDIINTFTPKIINLKFDEPKKDFSEKMMSNPKKILLNDEVLGKCYYFPENDIETGYNKNKFKDDVRKNFNLGMKNPIIKNILSKEIISRCKDDYKKFETDKGILTPYVQIILMLNNINFKYKEKRKSNKSNLVKQINFFLKKLI